MFYNYSLIGYFVLLFVAFVATLNGFMILKTRSFESPFGSRELIEGESARLAGLGLVTIGIASFAALVWFLIS